MQVKKSDVSDTSVQITVAASGDELKPLKNHTLTHFQSKVKVPGFREGKVPPEILEKHVDQQAFQAEFLEEAVSQLYASAVKQLDIRPVDRPQISIKKFVPFSQLEFDATIDVLGEVKLPDYKKISKSKVKAKVSEDDVKSVIESLAQQFAEKKDVNRAADAGDQVWIDFKGVDLKTKEAIKGGEGKDYPLVIGSDTFIPGFEPELIGMKAGEEKTFKIKFPKEYGVTSLAGKQVEFTVCVTKVQEVKKPELDDKLAAKAGPFKTFKELKDDIKKRLSEEKQHKLDRDFESDLIKDISDKSKVSIPDVLINDQVERMLYELRQNLTYQGQTIKEFLKSEGKSEEEYKEKILKPDASDRVKAGLVLAEIADIEKLTVSPEEVEIRIQLLKAQYQDHKMQQELDKPEAKRDIASRMLTEKTINKLVSYAARK